MTIGNAMRALSNNKRLRVLEWLKNPRAHFPPQVAGDLVRDGVCGLLIARKLKVSQPTASEHMRVLVQCGVVRPKRIKQWTFYRRDERRIRALKRDIAARL
jgi:DNA-binding transcriptional ArsR family regulator